MFDRREFARGIGALGAVTAFLGSARLVRADDLPPGAAPEGAVPSSPEEIESLLVALEAEARLALGPLGNCAQASFAVLNRQFGLAEGEFHRALSALPGIAVRGDTCGAVTGSLMALGLAFGTDPGAEPAQRRLAYLQGRELCRRFEEAQGSTLCRDIHTAAVGRWHDLFDPADAQAYQEAGGFEACQSAVASGVRIAAELILAQRAAAEG